MSEASRRRVCQRLVSSHRRSKVSDGQETLLTEVEVKEGGYRTIVLEVMVGSTEAG